MAIDTYTNCEAFHDGTGRWFWQVISNDRTWCAGVASNPIDAQTQADAHLAGMRAEMAARDRAAGKPEPAEPLLDLDALEKGLEEDYGKGRPQD
jgi:hypothetical protein